MNTTEKNGKSSPYDSSADLWTFGCVLMEMMVGCCPFQTKDVLDKYGSENAAQSFKNATLSMEIDWDDDWYSKVFTDHDQNLQCQDLVKNLLQRDVSKRFTMLQIKDHPFFIEHFEWSDVYDKKLKPPFIPPLDEIPAKDQKYFEEKNRADIKVRKLTAEENDAQWDAWPYMGMQAFQEEYVEFMAQVERDGEPSFNKPKSSVFCTVL